MTISTDDSSPLSTDMDSWYVSLGDDQLGPLRFAQLRAMAHQGRLLPGDFVRSRLSEVWVTAADLPGLTFPPSPASGKIADPLDATPCGDLGRPTAAQIIARQQWQRLRDIAFWHRWLNLCIIAAVVKDIVGFIDRPSIASAPLANLVWLVFYATFLVAIFYVSVRLARKLHWNRIALVLIFVPIANIFLLLKLDRSARQVLRLEGIELGFTGAFLPIEPPASYKPTGKVGSQ